MDIARGSQLHIEGRHYQVQDRLGGGSQGQVFQGLADDGGLVALKFITDPRRRHREADILRGWSSDHVVGLRGQGAYKDGEVLVMDLVDGLTLQRLQEICARLERGIHPALALTLIAHVARGLDEGYRTTRLKVHRDIKPSNVMLGRDGRGKILDFGIAYGLDLTCTGTPVATPLYMAPEQMEGARPAEELDHKTDQYSLGLLLAELVLGRPLRPMERDALARWLFLPGAELEAAQEQVGRQAPEIVAPLIRMLSWDPDGRFPSMGDVVVALDEARAACQAPDTLEAFAARLMDLKDRGQLPEPSDRALRPLVSARPATSETLLPDITGAALPIKPRVLSPALERTGAGPVNLADLRVLGTAPDGVGGLVGEVKVAEARPLPVAARPSADRPDPGREVGATGRPLTATADWYGRQRRNRAAAVGGLFVVAIVGAALYLTSDGRAAQATADVKGAPSAASEATVVARERVVKPRVIPPVAREKVGDKGDAQALKPAPAGKAVTAVASKEPVAKEAEVHAPEPAVAHHEAEAKDPDWRSASQVLALGGDAEALPVKVITDKRPGRDLDDSAQPVAAAGGVKSAPEAASKAAAQPAAAPPAKAAAAPPQGDATRQGDAPPAPAQAAPPEEPAEGDAEEALVLADPAPEPAPSEAASEPAPTLPKEDPRELVPTSEHAKTPPSPIREAAALAAGYPIDDEDFERQAAQLVAMAPTADRAAPPARPPVEAAEPAAAKAPATQPAPTGVASSVDSAPAAGAAPADAPPKAAQGPSASEAAPSVAVGTEAVVSLPDRPRSFSDRRWARQLVVLGFAAQHAGQEAQGKAYFEAARRADPQWDVPGRILSGELDHLPSEDEAAVSPGNASDESRG